MKVSLRIKMLIAVVSVSILIASVSIAISYTTYSETIDAYYRNMITNIANTTASMMDAEKIESYYETLETDAEYDRYLDILYKLRRENQIKYLYIEKIVGTNAVAIMDADETDGAMKLGDTFPVSEGADITALANGIPAFISNEANVGWVCSVFVPIENADGTVAALVGADISMDEVMAERYHFLLIVCVAIIASTLLSVIALLFLMQRFIVKPIKLLSGAAKNFMCKDGNGTVQINANAPMSSLQIRTRDEIEVLSDSVKLMETEIYHYIDNLTAVTAEKERIGAELNVAAKIQADMLPCTFPAFPERHEFDIYATMKPAKEVGGDFYDFFFVDEDHLAVVMADVSGKGVPAAMFMMISKTLLKSTAQTGLSPQEVLEKVNNQLCENNDAEMFVTVWLGVLEISTGKMRCANAGHEYPAIRRGDGSFELFKDKHGFVLAGMEGAKYREYELALLPGDILFVYTDGVTEATDAANELYSTQRMLSALNQKADVGGETLLEQVHEDIERFVGDAPQFDDITMLCLKINEKPDGMKKLSMTPELTRINEATAFFEGILEEKGFSPKLISQVNVVTDELFSNIAKYSGATTVTLGCQISEQRITLQFRDDGKPYDPTAIPNPDISLSAEEREIGGLGMFMVKKIMDQVSYRYADGLNILTIEKITQGETGK